MPFLSAAVWPSRRSLYWRKAMLRILLCRRFRNRIRSYSACAQLSGLWNRIGDGLRLTSRTPVAKGSPRSRGLLPFNYIDVEFKTGQVLFFSVFLALRQFAFRFFWHYGFIKVFFWFRFRALSFRSKIGFMSSGDKGLVIELVGNWGVYRLRVKGFQRYLVPGYFLSVKV